MSRITEKHMALGSFDVMLRPETPQEILDQLVDFGHVIITKSSRLSDRVDVLSKSIYTGVVTERDESGRKVSGHGMVWHLADEEDKGEAIDSLAGSYTFANAIRAVLPASVHEGTLYAVGGTKTIQFSNVSKRKAIEYICSLWNAEFVVTPQGYLNAGTAEQLFLQDPQSIVVWKKEIAADDPNLKSLPIASSKVAQSRAEYTTDVWLLPEGQTPALASVKQTLSPPTPYRDLWGHPIVRTRIISESGTLGTLANERALAFLARFREPRNQLDLSIKEFDIEGTIRVGDWTYVYDRSAQLYDTGIQKRFQGKYVNPTKIRIVGVDRPIRKTNGVFYRRHDGSLLKLTEFVVPEAGDTTLEVGAFAKSLTSAPAEPVGPRVNAGDPSIPAAPVITEVLTGIQRDAEGRTLAYLQPKWNEPLNTDGSTIVDGSTYEISYRLATEVQWQFTATLWDTRQALIQGLATGGEYNLRVRAKDLAGNVGAWSTVWTVIAAPDTVAPSTPAAPTVAGDAMTLQVIHLLGKASGGTYNLERDLRGIVVYADPNPNFLPSDANKLGEIPASSADLTVQTPAIGNFPIPAGGIRTVKVKAVDNAGNLSAASAGAGVTVPLVGSLNIGTATITDLHVANVSASKLRSGAIETALIDLVAAGRLRAGRDSAPFNYLFIDANGIYSARSGSAKYVGGTPALVYDLATGNLDLNGANINAGGIIGSTYRTSSTGRRVLIDPAQHFIEFYSGSSAELLPGVITQNFYGTEGNADRGASLILRAPQFSGIRGGELELYAQSADGSLTRQALLRSSGSAGGAFVRVREGRCLLGSSFSFPNFIELKEDSGQIYYMASNAGHVYQVTNKIAFEIENDRLDVWVGMTLNWNPLWLRAAGSIERVEFESAAGSSNLHGTTRAKLVSQSGGVLVKADQSGAVESRDVTDTAFRAMYAAAFTVNSDAAIKQDVAPIATPLARLRNMRSGLIEYRHKPEYDPDKPGLRRVKTGVLADQADEMILSAGYLRDGEGKPYPTRMVDLGAYLSLVAAAVVELSDLVDEDRPAGRKVKEVSRRPVKALPAITELMGVDTVDQLEPVDRVAGKPRSQPQPPEAAKREEIIPDARDR